MAFNHFLRKRFRWQLQKRPRIFTRTFTASERSLPVHARYLAKAIDVTSFHDWAVPAGTQRQVFGRERVILSLYESSSSCLDQDLRRTRDISAHAIIFSHGAAVFFNVADDLRDKCLACLQPFCAEAIPDGFQPMEDYSIVIRPVSSANVSTRSPNILDRQKDAFNLETTVVWTENPPCEIRLPHLSQWRSCSNIKVARRREIRSRNKELNSFVHFDYAALSQLDIHNLAVTATVLAQSVALDHYSVSADAMLEAFTRLNSSVERTGVFLAVEKNSLFRLVALNNTLFTDVIAKIGILERSDTAWRYIEYADVWEGLRDEFEVESRFQKIEFKLNLIQKNSKFFLEVLATDKSNSLEWIIIVLISIEIVVMTIEIAYNV